ncbi:MAG: Nif3-like dinuclear metal center hexameric protein [Actinomycetota bacterium]
MTCSVSDIIALMEEIAPPGSAEDWDSAGLQLGSARAKIDKVLTSLDFTPEVLREARGMEAGLVVCHHPPIFHPLRRLVTDEPGTALLSDALLAEVAVYAAHTSLDASPHGVNAALADLFGLRDRRPLTAPPREAYKLVTFVPPEHAAAVSAALFATGAGVIGGYTGCSFRVEGTGTFTPGPGTDPAYGDASGPNQVKEIRLEVAVETGREDAAVAALLASHPYEEVAYDLYRVHNPSGAGMGVVGDLPVPVSLGELADRCRELLENPTLRVAGELSAAVSRVAVCGGSGGGLTSEALRSGAQVFVSGDIGYHQAQEVAAAGLAVIDAGHYHTERPAVPRLAELLARRAREAGLTVEIIASEVNTCPWIDGGSE